MKLIYAIINTAVILLLNENVAAQRTAIDEALGAIYRPLRLLSTSFAARSSPKNVQRAGKVQRTTKIKDQLHICDPNTGPPRRSDKPPTSVHRLRPGDIDIICGMGDSLTAGNGISATNLLQILVENRGISWSIGGQGNWQKYLTIPNILKDFNPNLYGYSLKDGLATDRSSKFNVAELGAMSRDMPYEAKILYKRLSADKMVNLKEHWKLLTIFIGNNDFCSDICYYPNPKITLKLHEQNMLQTLRFLRDNVPRLMVNVVPVANLRLLTNLINVPYQCQTVLKFECPCLIGKDNQTLDYYDALWLKWIEVDSKVANRDEFNTETFTVNIQSFTQFGELPKQSNGVTDYGNLSADCFHLSQRAHASCANALWNNMLEPHGNKSHVWRESFDTVLCPTYEMPYLATRSNS